MTTEYGGRKKSAAPKKHDYVAMICDHVKVVRKNRDLPYFTFDELLHIWSWLLLTEDLASEVDYKIKRGHWRKGIV